MSLRRAVSAIMTSRPATMRASERLCDARARMFEHRIHHLPVVDEGGRLIGILTSNDLLRAGPSDLFAPPTTIDAELGHQTVGDAMTQDIVTVRPTETVERAAQLLALGCFHSLPVVTDEGNLIGIVTTADLLRYLMREARHDQRDHGLPRAGVIASGRTP